MAMKLAKTKTAIIAKAEALMLKPSIFSPLEIWNGKKSTSKSARLRFTTFCGNVECEKGIGYEAEDGAGFIEEEELRAVLLAGRVD